jgi:formiminotetrahydrofolate cyclodeaminase
MSPADSVWTSTVKQFTDRTASASPTPGGGSVAAVTVVFAGSLIVMCLEIAKKSLGESRIRVPLHRVEEACRIARKCADEDIVVFDAYISASRLPKATAVEGARRESARTTALVKATKVPLGCVQAAISIAEAAIESKQLIPSVILSDWASGLALIRAALASLLFNVAVNLRSLPKSKNNDALRKKYEDILLQTGDTVLAIGVALDDVTQRLGVAL